VTRSGERVNFSLYFRDEKRGSSAALFRRTLSPTQTKGTSPMGLTVFNQFPQLTRLLDRIARVANLVEVGLMPFVQELKRRLGELHEL